MTKSEKTTMGMKRKREIARAFLAGLDMKTVAWVFSLASSTVERVVRERPRRVYWRAGER